MDAITKEMVANQLKAQRNAVRKAIAIAHFDGDMSLLEKDFDSASELFNFVKGGWDGLPATITCKVISRRSQFPKWEDCPKDHLYFGIIRRQRGDKVIVVKHRTESILDCRVPAEQLTREDLVLAVRPTTKDNTCSKCGEFSTRIDGPEHVCLDCSEKTKLHKNLL